VTVRNIIACQLKRFATGADCEGVGAHASFLMFGGSLKQKPAAPSAGAAGTLLKQQRPILYAAAQSRLFNIAHFGGGLTGAMCGIASAHGIEPPSAEA
jgi:hypothetical protein